MPGNVPVQNASPVMGAHEEAIENAKGQRRYGEEVHRSNSFPMIAAKCCPSFRRLRVPRRPLHPAQDSSFRSIEAKDRKLPLDARSTPGGILGDHAKDELAQLYADALSPHRDSMSREPRPICFESSSVPSHDGLRLDKNQSLLPFIPERRNVSQNNRSEAAKRGCGRLCLKTSSCCRSARFSKSRSRRERKKRIGKIDRSLSSRSIRLVSHECWQGGCTVDMPDLNADRYFGEAQSYVL